MINSFPISVQNQQTVNINNLERQIRGALSEASGYVYFDTSGYNALNILITNPQGNAKINIEGSGDGVSWDSIQVVSLSSTPANLSAKPSTDTFTNPNGVGFYQVNKPARIVRIRQISPGSNHVTSLVVILHNGGTTPKQNEIRIPTFDSWVYAAQSGGIINTSPVTLKGVVNGSYLNALLSLNITNAGTVDTEVLIRSNATLGGGSPTVVFRTFLKAGTSQNIEFTPALKTIVNNLFEIVCVTASIIYVNAQGTVISN